MQPENKPIREPQNAAALHRPPAIRRIFVEESCLDHPYAVTILSRASAIPVTVIPDRTLPQEELPPYPLGLQHGKQFLLLARNRGKFLKPCPATREYRCCDYQVLNIGMNCPMDCVYCILQSYMNNPWLSFFVNIEDLFSELEGVFAQDPHRFRRIGTGEFTDSLALDHLTGLSRHLVEFIGRHPATVLELKTKTVQIDNLRGLDHRGKTIMAWSVNSPLIMTREEIRTAGFAERLAAASQAASWGYRLAFHFDPIIHHPGWQEGYEETIRQIFAAVPGEAIAWISMGALRYLPQLKQIATTRFPASAIFSEEFVPGLDGKMRYFRTLRVELYRHILGLLREHADERTCIYLCMENDEVWREVFGFTPEERGGLPAMLDRAVKG